VSVLARAFFRGAGVGPDAHAPAQDQLDALERRLVGCVAAAQAAWPKVAVADERYADHLGMHALDEAGLAGLRTSDLYLACACLEGVSDGLVAFDAAFLAAIDVHVHRYDPSPSFADEVRQVLRERFFVWVNGESPRIAGYSGRGALGAWVRVAAVRVALRLSQQRSPTPSLDTATAGEPELDYIRDRYRAAFGSGLADALNTLDAEEHKLLRLHFVDGLTIDQLGPLYGVSRSTAARRLADAREQLLRATRERLEELLGISGRELESLVALVRSRIEINVSSVFRANKAG
jgi:RNA polymerase sigma-70 factor, ECF subfamily